MSRQPQAAPLVKGKGKERCIALEKSYARICMPIDGLRVSQIVEIVSMFPDQNAAVFRTSVGRVTKLISTDYASPETGKLRISANFGPFKQGDLLVTFEDDDGSSTVKMYNAQGINAPVPVELLVSPRVQVQKKPKSPVRFKDFSHYAMIQTFYKGLKPYQVVAVLTKTVPSDGSPATISCVTPKGNTEVDVVIDKSILIPSTAKYRLLQDYAGSKKGALLIQFEVSQIATGHIIMYTIWGKSLWITPDMVEPWKN